LLTDALGAFVFICFQADSFLYSQGRICANELEFGASYFNTYELPVNHFIITYLNLRIMY
jgi:hypothetical protein